MPRPPIHPQLKETILHECRTTTKQLVRLSRLLRQAECLGFSTELAVWADDLAGIAAVIRPRPTLQPWDLRDV